MVSFQNGNQVLSLSLFIFDFFFEFDYFELDCACFELILISGADPPDVGAPEYSPEYNAASTAHDEPVGILGAGPALVDAIDKFDRHSDVAFHKFEKLQSRSISGSTRRFLALMRKCKLFVGFLIF